AESYLNFVVTYILGLAVIFQLPLLIFIFDHVHPFPPGTLSSTQRFVVIGATVLAAVITPTPDAINMAIVAVPIIVVYQLGALAVFIRRHKSRRVAKIVDAEVVEPLSDALELAFLEDASTESTPEVVVAATAEPLTASIQEPVVEQAPAAETPAVSTQSPQVRRSVDGFMRSRQPATLSIPPRQSTPAVLPQRQSNRPVRSIDGFLPA
ncbi:twin-arginine translocase subunit TatC, partial [Candidatus Saccharibacteria bacterium]|nr:twin-arginine translocase subunit TatC [Candidatus Saccharibacteria bacterium]